MSTLKINEIRMRIKSATDKNSYWFCSISTAFRLVSFLVVLSTALFMSCSNSAGPEYSELQFTISFPQASTKSFHVEFRTGGFDLDTVIIKMPRWSPGYYQIMDFADNLENITATDGKGESLPLISKNSNTWILGGVRNKEFVISYDIKTIRKFVGTSYVDTTHAYIIPAGACIYIEGMIDNPVTIDIRKGEKWTDIATGLEESKESPGSFYAKDFDILYDCPILIGNLEELSPFIIDGVAHRFIGLNLGDFDRELFMEKLESAIKAGTELIGDIPYDEYTFIGIGSGMGGIEHLNNTTISFNGSNLKTDDDYNRVLSFISHEYFHNYNVKRIRPYNLGPFDYDAENRTYQLWISEGLTVYYEYIMLKNAGLIGEKEFFNFLGGDISIVENDSGRFYQSLAQASYNTWDEGPFGSGRDGIDKSISVYNKGAVVGFLLDLKIRYASQNKNSLDDVMRLLYWKYYKALGRGFTAEEMQEACEMVAGVSLSDFFEYIYTTKELDYKTYLDYAGLEINKEEVLSARTGKKVDKFSIKRHDQIDASQLEILNSWLGGMGI